MVYFFCVLFQVSNSPKLRMELSSPYRQRMLLLPCFFFESAQGDRCHSPRHVAFACDSKVGPNVRSEAISNLKLANGNLSCKAFDITFFAKPSGKVYVIAYLLN